MQQIQSAKDAIKESSAYQAVKTSMKTRKINASDTDAETVDEAKAIASFVLWSAMITIGMFAETPFPKVYFLYISYAMTPWIMSKIKPLVDEETPYQFIFITLFVAVMTTLSIARSAVKGTDSLQGVDYAGAVFIGINFLILLFYARYRHETGDKGTYNKFLLVYVCTCAFISFVSGAVCWGASEMPITRVTGGAVSVSFFIIGTLSFESYKTPDITNYVVQIVYGMVSWFIEVLNVGAAVVTAVLLSQMQTTGDCGQTLVYITAITACLFVFIAIGMITMFFVYKEAVVSDRDTTNDPLLAPQGIVPGSNRSNSHYQSQYEPYGYTSGRQAYGP